MGLRDGHPEKEGILVSLDNMVAEVKARLERKKALESVVQAAEGLKVVDGIKGDDAAAEAPAATQ